MRLLNIRYISLAILFAFLFTGLSGVFLNKVSAASDYDDLYHTTNDIAVWTKGRGLDEYLYCNKDVSSDWSRYILEEGYDGSYYHGSMDSSYADSLEYAIDNAGMWGVTEYYHFAHDARNMVYIYWTEDNGLALDWYYDPSRLYAYSTTGNLHMVSMECEVSTKQITVKGISKNSSRIIVSSDSSTQSGFEYANNYLFTGLKDYPDDYEGLLIEDKPGTDNDSDGLNVIQEIQQGTSDSNPDSDGDGINDLKESIWYVDRDDVFCDTSTSPYTCAYPDPTTQDIYVEIDWMNDTANNVLYMPTSTQLGLVTSMFANEGINLHFDVGDYGGGNELNDYIESLERDAVSSMPDFSDYKNGGDGVSSNFSADRQNIWRYMIYGNLYSISGVNSTSSGWSEVMGDDLFIAGGIINSLTGAVSHDRSVANTIAHELGHSLCLSRERAYFEQGPECVFGGIDNKSGDAPVNNPDGYYNLEDYESVMNYRYQLTDKDDMGVVDYSRGPDGATDHDDWTAVKNNIGKFSGSHTQYVEFGASMRGNVLSSPLSADGLVVAE